MRFITVNIAGSSIPSFISIQQIESMQQTTNSVIIITKTGLKFVVSNKIDDIFRNLKEDVANFVMCTLLGGNYIYLNKNHVVSIAKGALNTVYITMESNGIHKLNDDIHSLTRVFDVNI